jgi:hypothetical protein
MPQAAERNEAFLGRCTLGVILAISTAVMFVPTLRERSLREYRLVVPAGTDLHGVTLDSKVLVGGIDAGRVRKITPLINDRPLDEEEGDGSSGVAPDDRITGTELVLAVDPGIRLFSGASAAIQREMVSGLATISVPNLGSTAEGSLPLGNGDLLTLLRERDAFGELLEKRESDERFGWMTKAYREVEASWKSTREEADSLVAEVRASWPPLAERGSAVFGRFEAMGGRIEALFAEVGRLRDDAVATDGDAEPLIQAIRDDLAELSASSERIGERVDAAFPRARAAFDRETERLASALHAIETRFASLRLSANWDEMLADFALAGGELGRALGDLIGLAARSLRGETAAERTQDRIDQLGRDLLASLEQARAAEAELRAIAAAGATQAELLPPLAEAIGKLGELIDAAGRIERAYRTLRLEAIPAP